MLHSNVVCFYTKMKKIFPAIPLFFLSIIFPVNLAIADDEKAENPQQNQPPKMPVNVIEIHAEPMRLWNEFSGRLAAVDSVEIKPRVTGELTKIYFEDGDIVNKGDLLFEIDSRPFKAEVARIKGQLASANSQANLAKTELARIENLYKDKVVPKRDLDNAKNDYQVALANIQTSKAQLQRAELDIEYANIHSPINGRISRAEFTEGNLIETMMGAPVLTMIVATDTLYAEFDVDEQTYINLSRQSAEEKSMPVEMTLASDNSVTYEGHIHSFDNQINSSTGTIRARAILQNNDGILLPGMFVKIRIGTVNKNNMILVTERAIGTDQDKKFIYTLDDKNQIQYQEVKIGNRIAGKRIIETDLAEGTKVVINNIQMVRPGMAVEPTVVNSK